MPAVRPAPPSDAAQTRLPRRSLLRPLSSPYRLHGTCATLAANVHPSSRPHAGQSRAPLSRAESPTVADWSVGAGNSVLNMSPRAAFKNVTYARVADLESSRDFLRSQAGGEQDPDLPNRILRQLCVWRTLTSRIVGLRSTRASFLDPVFPTDDMPNQGLRHAIFSPKGGLAHVAHRISLANVADLFGAQFSHWMRFADISLIRTPVSGKRPVEMGPTLAAADTRDGCDVQCKLRRKFDDCRAVSPQLAHLSHLGIVHLRRNRVFASPNINKLNAERGWPTIEHRIHGRTRIDPALLRRACLTLRDPFQDAHAWDDAGLIQRSNPPADWIVHLSLQRRRKMASKPVRRSPHRPAHILNNAVSWIEKTVDFNCPRYHLLSLVDSQIKRNWQVIGTAP